MSKVWNKIDSVGLAYGSDWEDSQITVRAKVFGKMLDLAEGQILYYKSDLWHDALWINERLIGSMQFDWIVRESGTYIGESAANIRDEDLTNSVRYRFDIRSNKDRRWVLDIHQAVDYETIFPLTQDHLKACRCQECIDKELELWQYGRCELCGNGSHGGDCYRMGNMESSTGGWNNMSQSIPTPRNEVTTTRKANTMDDYIDVLREKLSEARDELSNANDKLSELQDYIYGLDSYVDELDNYIDSLDSGPEYDGEFEFDTSFSSSS